MRNIKKLFLVFTVLMFTCYLIILEYHWIAPKNHIYFSGSISKCKKDLKLHKTIVEKYYDNRENWQTSNLGSILFKNESPQVYRRIQNRNKTFSVLIWRYFDWLKNRHVKNFGTATGDIEDVLNDCSAKNCIFSGDDAEIDAADAVVVHMLHGLHPEVQHRNPQQRWIFLSDESPMHTFSLTRSAPKLSKLAGVFNWTMTYRSDSDIPVPYGRTVPLNEPMSLEVCSESSEEVLQKLVPYWEDKQFVVLAAILMSNCKAERLEFIRQVRRRAQVDIHGRCSDTDKFTCPGHFRKDCDHLQRYLFYLVLENSSCRQYLTEKLFNHAYTKGAIPVILGPPLQDCERLLPPNSFLHVNQYDSVEALAEHMVRIARDLESILSYHSWRKHFTIVNEHGYFGSQSYHLCRVCEALNYNDDETTIYDFDELRLFFSRKISCNKISY